MCADIIVSTQLGNEPCLYVPAVWCALQQRSNLETAFLALESIQQPIGSQEYRSLFSDWLITLLLDVAVLGFELFGSTAL